MRKPSRIFKPCPGSARQAGAGTGTNRALPFIARHYRESRIMVFPPEPESLEYEEIKQGYKMRRLALKVV